MYSRIRLVILICTVFTLNFSAFAQNASLAVQGRADLSSFSFSKGESYELKGEWEFYWKAFISPSDFQNYAYGPVQYAFLPGYWTSLTVDDKKLPAIGSASYHISLDLPDNQVYGLFLYQMVSAYTLYVNGEKLASNGLASVEPAFTKPEHRAQAVYFTPINKKADIVLHVSNKDYRMGGQWKPITIGLAPAISSNSESMLIFELFLFGAIIMIGFYNIALFAFRTKNRAPLWFGLFCIVVALRLVATGHTAITNIFPFFPWELQVKLELSVFYLGGIFFACFFKSLFPKEFPKVLFVLLLSGFFVFTLLAIVTPVSFFNTLVIPLEIYAICGILFVIILLVIAAIKRREHALLFLLGFAFFAIAAVNDVLYSINVIHTIYILPIGLFLFIFSQAVALARIFSHSFTEVERLSDRLFGINESMERFVPHEFLNFLDKASISEVHLGDQSLRNMTILFSDIRSFTTLSESMTPQENFNFLNSYLARIGPIVRNNEGFIDKYIGDAIMALFPNNIENALKASLEIQNELKLFNKEKELLNELPIKVGIGLHCGPAMLGIIGEAERLESTVISDAVNLASRIESLTKYYKTDVLVSGTILANLEHKNLYTFRRIDRVTVKGKSEACDLYELLDVYDEGERVNFIANKELFDTALNLFLHKEYKDAHDLFSKCASMNPYDGVAKLFMNRCLDSRNIQLRD